MQTLARLQNLQDFGIDAPHLISAEEKGTLAIICGCLCYKDKSIKLKLDFCINHRSPFFKL